MTSQRKCTSMLPCEKGARKYCENKKEKTFNLCWENFHVFSFEGNFMLITFAL